MASPVLSTRKLGFQWITKDPFLFCAHHNDVYPEGNSEMGPVSSLSGRNLGSDFDPQNSWRMYHGQKVPGFPVHPHRGFETITVVLSGYIDHTDSAGGAGRYGNGDVQWMTAGTGLQHSEMFPLIFKDKPNPLVLFQIWLNLPGSKKLVKPYFKMLWKELIPKITLEDKSGKKTEVIVITGKMNDISVQAPSPDSWAANPDNEVAIIRYKLEPNAEYIMQPASAGINRSLFYYQGGEITLNGITVSSGNAIDVQPDMELLIKNGQTESEIMLLQGKPINEPVAQYGPFVMNTQNEIQQTISEYRRTEFGGWPWPAEEYVHGDKPRFAQYSDGTIEYPEEK
ncbi:MAG: pirin family protein [Chloroflexota bacterium]